MLISREPETGKHPLPNPQSSKFQFISKLMLKPKPTSTRAAIRSVIRGYPEPASARP